MPKDFSIFFEQNVDKDCLGCGEIFLSQEDTINISAENVNWLFHENCLCTLISIISNFISIANGTKSLDN